MEKNNPDDTIICSQCNAENSRDNKFCLECGKPIEQDIESSPKICSNCQAVVPTGIKFCTECGAKIEEPTSTVMTCPVCYVKLEPGLKFCTACGAEVTPAQTSKKEIKEPSTSDEEPIVDSVMNTGKNIMKDFGDFLDKAASSIDNKEGSSSAKREKTKPRIKPKMKNQNPGYLVCEKCGGYYQLQLGESADDFTEKCECGGKLEHKETI